MARMIFMRYTGKRFFSLALASEILWCNWELVKNIILTYCRCQNSNWLTLIDVKSSPEFHAILQRVGKFSREQKPWFIWMKSESSRVYSHETKITFITQYCVGAREFMKILRVFPATISRCHQQTFVVFSVNLRESLMIRSVIVCLDDSLIYHSFRGWKWHTFLNLF